MCILLEGGVNMFFFKDVGCHFYCKENNISYNNSQELECKVICQSGTASLGIYDMGVQFLIDEKVLRKALINYKVLETSGVYINFTDKNVVPIKCKIKLTVTKNETQLEVLNTNSFIEMRTEHLMKILDMK
jgi:hypothetical protein